MNQGKELVWMFNDCLWAIWDEISVKPSSETQISSISV